MGLTTYSVVRAATAPLVKVLGKSPVVSGLSNIPDGPVVLACNHLAVIDPFFLSVYMPSRLVFAAKAQYFTGVGVKAQFVRRFMAATGQVPLDRDDPDAAMETLERLAEMARSGKTIALFPEGYSSPDGRLFRGKTGPARVARMAEVPLVPVALSGTNLVNPPGKPGTHLRRSSVRIDVGKPIDASGDDLRETTDRVMAAIQTMSGQTPAPFYASVIKEPHKHPELARRADQDTRTRTEEGSAS